MTHLPVAAASFGEYCRGTLYECILNEKTAALQPYMLLHSMLQAREALSCDRAVPANKPF